MTETTFIYALECPTTGEIRYVGKSNNPKNRYYEHLRERGNSYKCNWIQSLIKNGLKPELIIIEVVNSDIWKERECYWINYYKENNIKLTNSTLGGDDFGTIGLRFGKDNPFYNKKHSEESRKKIRESRAKQIISSKSEESKKKTSDKLKGRTFSSETIERMRVGQRGNNNGSGNKGKVAWNKGLGMTPEEKLESKRKAGREYMQRRRIKIII